MTIIRWLLLFFLIIGPLASAQAEPVLDIQHWITDKGTKTYFVANPELPMIDIYIAFAAGSSRDGNQAGIAALTATLLKQGSGNLNANQIADSFADHGALFSTDVDKDMAIVSLRSLVAPEHFPAVLDSFILASSQPNFNPEDLQREQQRQLAAIEESHQSPLVIANQALYAILYQDGPYAHPTLGEPQTVADLRQRDVKAFYEKFYVAKNAVIVMVGDIDRDAANNIAAQISNAFPDRPAAAALAEADDLPHAIIEKIDFPALQTMIKLGQIGINYDTADYFPLMIGNYILGGGALVSRLNQAVREQRGLSYIINSQFIPLASRGPFVITLGTENQQVQDALTIVQQVLDDFIHEGPTAAELNAAKKYVSGNFALLLDSNRSIAHIVLNIAFYQRALDHLDTYLESISTVTQKEILQAFQYHIDPAKMATILVGGEDDNS